MTEETKVKAPIIVEFENGETKNFGERGRLLSTVDFTAEGFDITFYVANGEMVTYNHKVKGLDTLTARAAAFGFETKAKASTAGTELDGIKAVIVAKIEEFTQGIWTSRATTGEVLTALTQIQTAYAIVNGIDYNKDEGIAKVNAVFAALSKEDKSALYKDAKISVAIAQLKLDAAKAREKALGI